MLLIYLSISVSHADIYKMIDSNGSIYYSDNPEPDPVIRGVKSQRIMETSRNKEKLGYTGKIGVHLFSIISSLSLNEDKILYICYSRDYNRYNYLQIKNNYNGLKEEGEWHRFIYLENSQYCKKQREFRWPCGIDGESCYAGWKGKPINRNFKAETQKFENKWFYYIENYLEIGGALVVINNKFNDILNRLYVAVNNRIKLENEFSEYKDSGINYNQYISDLDRDVKLLSSHGMKLATVTKRLFKIIKPIVINSEMRIATISGRKEVMVGLRSFEKEINKINKFTQIGINYSVRKITNSIGIAINDLEKALAK